MLISRHKQATTTPKIRAAIQASAGPAGLLFCSNCHYKLPLVERLPYFTCDSTDVVSSRPRALDTKDVGKQAM